MIKGDIYEPKFEIMVVITHACNLRCKYCYYEKEANRIRPNVPILVERIYAEISRQKDNATITITFHGGEPFLEWDAMRSIAEYIWREYPNVKFRATTNGTVLTQEIKRWLVAHKDKFIITLSIDGPEEIHDKERGRSFCLIDKNFFVSTYPNVGVKMTVSPQTISKMFDSFVYLNKLGFYVNPSLAREVPWALPYDLCIYSKELDKLARWYIDNPVVPPGDLLGINFLNPPFGDAEPRTCGCGAGRNLVAFDLNGDKYPCHTFIKFGIPPNKTVVDLQLRMLASNDANILGGPCRDCFIAPWCAPCYGLSYLNRGSMGLPDERLCEFSRRTIVKAAHIQAVMLTAGTKYALLDKYALHLRPMVANTIMKVLEWENNSKGKEVRT